MRTIRCWAMMAVLLAPVVASAQGRVPATDSAAVGGDIGMFLPAQDGLDAGLAFEGFYEYYFTPRTSLRTGLGWASPGFEGAEDASLRHFRVAVDGVYNWEGGEIHPFVGGGLGIYFLQARSSGESIGDSETKVGATIFGGVELFTSQTLAIKGELRYHLIANTDAGLNPDGATLTIGVKKYF